MDALIIALAVGAIAWAGFQSIQLGSGGAFQHWQASLRRHQESDLHRSGVATQLTKFFHEFRRHRKPASTWRSLAVADIVQESPDTKSFLLVDPSGDRLPSFAPGQHLLVESPSGPLPTLRRCYSLSHGPGKGYYQFTVKKKALGSVESSLSTRLHQQLAIGELIRVKGPQGTFTSDAIGKTPVVLIAAGVGITPMISMLEGILEKQPNASVWLFYQVRDAEHEIFGSKLRKISQKYTQFHLRIFHSRSTENAIRDEVTFRGKFGVGHIHHEIRSLAPHFFMCGPEEWMRQIQKV